MTLEVIGAGFGRRGTMSLKVALEELGFGRCYHMIEVFEHPEPVSLWGGRYTRRASRLGEDLWQLPSGCGLADNCLLQRTYEGVPARESTTHYQRS